MTAKELGEWRAYYEIEPWGEERADLRMGITVSTLLLPHLKEDAKPPKPGDFMPDFDGSKEKRQIAQTQEEQMRILGRLTDRKKTK